MKMFFLNTIIVATCWALCGAAIARSCGQPAEQVFMAFVAGWAFAIGLSILLDGYIRR